MIAERNEQELEWQEAERLVGVVTECELNSIASRIIVQTIDGQRFKASRQSFETAKKPALELHDEVQFLALPVRQDGFGRMRALKPTGRIVQFSRRNGKTRFGQVCLKKRVTKFSSGYDWPRQEVDKNTGLVHGKTEPWTGQ